MRRGLYSIRGRNLGAKYGMVAPERLADSPRAIHTDLPINLLGPDRGIQLATLEQRVEILASYYGNIAELDQARNLLYKARNPGRLSLAATLGGSIPENIRFIADGIAKAGYMSPRSKGGILSPSVSDISISGRDYGDLEIDINNLKNILTVLQSDNLSAFSSPFVQEKGIDLALKFIRSPRYQALLYANRGYDNIYDASSDDSSDMQDLRNSKDFEKLRAFHALNQKFAGSAHHLIGNFMSRDMRIKYPLLNVKSQNHALQTGRIVEILGINKTAFTNYFINKVMLRNTVAGIEPLPPRESLVLLEDTFLSGGFESNSNNQGIIPFIVAAAKLVAVIITALKVAKELISLFKSNDSDFLIAQELNNIGTDANGLIIPEDYGNIKDGTNN